MRYLSSDKKSVFEVVRVVQEYARATHYMFRTTGGRVTHDGQLYLNTPRTGDPEVIYVTPLSDEEWEQMVAEATKAAEEKVERQIVEMGLGALPEEVQKAVREGFLKAALKLPEVR